MAEMAPGHHRGDAGDEDVAVLDVAHLVGEDALELARAAARCWMPWVTAIAACLGLRPVANALGCSAGVT